MIEQTRTDRPFPILPWIDAYKPGIDMSLVRSNLASTMEQRFQNLQAMSEFYEAAQKAKEERIRKRFENQ